MAIKILSLIDSFKGSISSLEISKFLKRNFTNFSYFPISDGGEYFLDTVKEILMSENYKELKIENIHSLNPLNKEKINAKIILDSKNNAYIESANIIGLSLVNKNNDQGIFKRSSYGIGEVLLKINKLNINTLYIGLGGSATSDLGIGLLKALNLKFFDKNNKDITEEVNFIEDIVNVKKLDFSNVYSLNYKIEIINDVSNPLLGKNGANYVYAFQKGAKNEDIEKLEEYFHIFYKLLVKHAKNRLIDLNDEIGDGSAGGLGFIFKHVLKGKYNQGIEFILKKIDFKNIKNKYDYIFTGEGSLDYQSFNKKVVGGILDALDSKDKNKLVIICGQNNIEINKISEKYKNLIKNIYSLSPRYALKEEAIKNPKKYLKEIVFDIKKDLGILKFKDHTFPPFINKNSEILILGSFPSVKSLEKNFYYMNKTNRFYNVLATIFNINLNEISALEKEKEFLNKNHIALYDVIKSCYIEESKDESIKKDILPIDIKELLNEYNNIKKIIVSGKKAEKLFKQYLLKEIENKNVEIYYLPSTSSANASFNIEKLVEIYKKALF